MFKLVIGIVSQNFFELFWNTEVIVAFISGVFGLVLGAYYYKVRINANGIKQTADIKVVKAELKSDVTEEISNIANSIEKLVVQNDEEHKDIVQKLEKNTIVTEKLFEAHIAQQSKKSFGRDILNIGINTISDISKDANDDDRPNDKRVNIYLKAATNNLKAFTCELLDCGVDEITEDMVNQTASFNIQTMKTMFVSLFGSDLSEEYMASGRNDRNRFLDAIHKILSDKANSKVGRIQNAAESYAYALTSNFYSFYNIHKLWR